MSGDFKNISRVKLFLMAKSENDLVKLQLRNNFANNMMYDYGNPQKIDSGYIVWFFADITKHRVVG